MGLMFAGQTVFRACPGFSFRHPGRVPLASVLKETKDLAQPPGQSTTSCTCQTCTYRGPDPPPIHDIADNAYGVIRATGLCRSRFPGCQPSPPSLRRELMLSASPRETLSIEAIDIHPQRAQGKAAVLDAHLRRRAAGEEQWQQVLVAERLRAAQAPAGGSREARPRRRPGAFPPSSHGTPAPRARWLPARRPVQFAQVVGDAAGTDQQHAFPRSWRRAWLTRLCRAGPRRLGRDSWSTGMSACGYIRPSGTQVPWSNGRCGSAWPAGRRPGAVRSSAAPAPARLWPGSARRRGAAESRRSRARYPAPRRRLPAGRRFPSARKTTRIAFGRGSSVARRRSCTPLAPGSRASIGEPWEI